MEENKVLIIIVSYNSMQWAQKCYDSIRNSIVPCDTITIDNGSIDGTQEFIKSNYPEVELIETGSNLGFGRANNIGLRKFLQGSYNYAYLLNQDAWLFPDTLGKLIDVQKKNPQFGILSPMQLEANLKHLDNYFLYILENKYQDKRFLEELYFERLPDVVETKEVMAAHWLLNRDCIAKTGVFSPAFPHYGEDDNFEDRCIYNGFKIGIVPAAQAVHDREKRSMTIAKIAYLRYIYYIVELSALTKKVSTITLLCVFLGESIKFIGTNRSFAKLKYFITLLTRLREISQYRKESMREGAFLV